MPSFDVVSEVDMQEITNALTQANKEVITRFDLKNSGSECRREDNVITVISDENFHLEQVVDVLMSKLAKRNINLQSLKKGEPAVSGKTVRVAITIRQGIDAETGKKIVKAVKEAKLKVQAAIQEDKVRVTGKKRDDLQTAIAMLKELKLDLPLQFNNFRD